MFPPAWQKQPNRQRPLQRVERPSFHFVDFRFIETMFARNSSGMLMPARPARRIPARENGNGEAGMQGCDDV